MKKSKLFKLEIDDNHLCIYYNALFPNTIYELINFKSTEITLIYSETFPYPLDLININKLNEIIINYKTKNKINIIKNYFIKDMKIIKAKNNKEPKISRFIN